jgi:hypothetical protein
LTHAFLITAYKDEVQVCNLVNRLLHYPSFIYLYIDKKSRQLQNNLRNKFSGNNRIIIISDPVNVYWGGFSHLKAILMLVEKAYENSGNKRFHLISGQDFPVKSKNDFDLFFRENEKEEFITSFILPASQWANGGLDRINYFHLNDIFDPKKYIFPRANGRLLRLQKWLGLKRKMPSYISDFYGGGTWWSLSRNAIGEIIAFNKKHPGFIRHFKHTYCGEEIFFQTILNNSPLKNSIVPEDLRYIDWDSNAYAPPALDISYLEKILGTKKMFARKFDSVVSEELRKKLIERIEEVVGVN